MSRQREKSESERERKDRAHQQTTHVLHMLPIDDDAAAATTTASPTPISVEVIKAAAATAANCLIYILLNCYGFSSHSPLILPLNSLFFLLSACLSVGLP